MYAAKLAPGWHVESASKAVHQNCSTPKHLNTSQSATASGRISIVDIANAIDEPFLAVRKYVVRAQNGNSLSQDIAERKPCPGLFHQHALIHDSREGPRGHFPGPALVPEYRLHDVAFIRQFYRGKPILPLKFVVIQEFDRYPWRAQSVS